MKLTSASKHPYAVCKPRESFLKQYPWAVPVIAVVGSLLLFTFVYLFTGRLRYGYVQQILNAVGGGALMRSEMPMLLSCPGLGEQVLAAVGCWKRGTPVKAMAACCWAGSAQPNAVVANPLNNPPCSTALVLLLPRLRAQVLTHSHQTECPVQRKRLKGCPKSGRVSIVSTDVEGRWWPYLVLELVLSARCKGRGACA